MGLAGISGTGNVGNANLTPSPTEPPAETTGAPTVPTPAAEVNTRNGNRPTAGTGPTTSATTGPTYLTDRPTAGAAPSTSRLRLRSENFDGQRDDVIAETRADLRETRRSLTELDDSGNLVNRIVGTALETRENILEERLQEHVDMNFLGETLFALGASEERTEVLDGAGGVDIISDHGREEEHADAHYSTESGDIAVHGDMLEEVREVREELQKQGIIDANGNVLDAELLDESEIGNEAIKAAALISVHEHEHFEQDGHGLEDEYNRILAQNPNMSPAEKERLLVEMIEFPAYREQELEQFNLGAGTKTNLTLDDNGQDLPYETAVERIINFRATGDPEQPATAAPEGGSIIERLLEGRRFGGDDVNGRRFGGDDLNGRRFGGDDVNGRRFGGDDLNGRRFGGDDLNGRRFGGDDLNGRRFGGDDLQ